MKQKINTLLALFTILVVLVSVGVSSRPTISYAAYSVSENPSDAENATNTTCLFPCPYTCILCIFTGTTIIVTAALEAAFDSLMDDAEENMWVENGSYPNRGIGRAIDDMVQETYEALNRTEQDIAGWFRAWFHYDYRPSLQSWTDQYSTALMQRAYHYGTFLDAERQQEQRRDHQAFEVRTRRDIADASERTCAVGTLSEGLMRARQVGRHMRRARERQTIALATNQSGSASATNGAAYDVVKWQEFRTLLCEQNANNAEAACATSGSLPDADVRIVNTLFNPKTIDLSTDANLEVALRHLNDNIAGKESYNPIENFDMIDGNGSEEFLSRRIAIAKRSVARNIPEFIASQRMPGSDMATFVQVIRDAAQVEGKDISANPSYQEVIRTVTEEKFLSGKYGLNLMETEGAVQREKLVLSSMYLVRLRDYYELLERMALVLAVQTATQLDRQPMPYIGSDRPTE